MKQQFIVMIDKKIENMISCIAYAKWEWEIFYKWKKEWLEELRAEVEKMEEETVSKKDALSFAYWHHNWLINSERWEVEEEFEKYMNEIKKWERIISEIEESKK
jgi:hypothetical protein